MGKFTTETQRRREETGAHVMLPLRGLVLLAGMLSLVSCTHFEPVSVDQLNRGYVLMLPGVANRPSSMMPIAQGLRDGGIGYAIEQDRWGDYPFGELKNVMAIERNRRRAAERAQKVAAYWQAHPQQPIILIGYSGGGAMALFVCESLPPDVSVDRVILLAAAISPDYDLSPAMRATRGIVNYYSAGDWFDAGLLTQMFGTMDRKHTSTAGRVGFIRSDASHSGMCELVQVPWTPAWRKLGHAGGHAGWDSRDWAREVLAPVIREARLRPVATMPS